MLVVYTPEALAAEGNSPDAVVAQAELAYTESGEIRTDLHRLVTPGDGFLNEVQPMRDAVRADMVCLFTNKASQDGYNGYAEILTVLRPDGEILGFSVVNIQRATVDHLFAHELGHNMGCDHDRENTTGACASFPFPTAGGSPARTATNTAT